MNPTSQQKNISYKIRCGVLALLLTFQLVFTPVSFAQGVSSNLISLPPAGTMIVPTTAYKPMLIKGVNLYPDDPFKFDFLFDTGESGLTGEAYNREAERLVKYFLATMTVPSTELWVNLSPYEKNRIIPNTFGRTEMGRDLLAQDYLLKQLASSLMYPEDKIGKEFWNRVYTKAQAQFGTTEIPLNTFNKVWIVPQAASIYEHEKGAFIVDTHLKVMLEEDYVALEANKNRTDHGVGDVKLDEMKVVSGVTAQVVREVLIPEIEREVNEGKTFAPLRQVYNSMLLATWYKRALQESLLTKIYANQGKTEGVESLDRESNQKIYDQYLKAFEQGVYNYVKEEYDATSQSIIPRKYFSGGIAVGDQAILSATEENAIDAAKKADDLRETVVQIAQSNGESVVPGGITRREAIKLGLAAVGSAFIPTTSKADSGEVVILKSGSVKVGDGVAFETQQNFLGGRSIVLRGVITDIKSQQQGNTKFYSITVSQIQGRAANEKHIIGFAKDFPDIQRKLEEGELAHLKEVNEALSNVKDEDIQLVDNMLKQVGADETVRQVVKDFIKRHDAQLATNTINQVLTPEQKKELRTLMVKSIVDNWNNKNRTFLLETLMPDSPVGSPFSDLPSSINQSDIEEILALTFFSLDSRTETTLKEMLRANNFTVVKAIIGELNQKAQDIIRRRLISFGANAADFSPSEFRQAQTQLALFKGMREANLPISPSEIPLEEINRLLLLPNLFTLLNVKPNGSNGIISRLQKGEDVDPLELRRFNRQLIESKFPALTPKLADRPAVSPEDLERRQAIVTRLLGSADKDSAMVGANDTNAIQNELRNLVYSILKGINELEKVNSALITDRIKGIKGQAREASQKLKSGKDSTIEWLSKMKVQLENGKAVVDSSVAQHVNTSHRLPGEETGWMGKVKNGWDSSVLKPVDQKQRQLFIRNLIQKKSGRDSGMMSNPVKENKSDPLGGIDLNPAIVDLQIKRSEHGVIVPSIKENVNPLDLNINGLVPFVIQTVPVTNVLPLLSVKASTVPEPVS